MKLEPESVIRLRQCGSQAGVYPRPHIQMATSVTSLQIYPLVYLRLGYHGHVGLLSGTQEFHCSDDELLHLLILVAEHM